MKARCRRCENVIDDPSPRSCPVCGLGEPDTHRPPAVRITVVTDVLLVLLMLGVAAVSLAATPALRLVEHAALDSAMDSLRSAWVPFGFALASAIVLTICTVGIAKGRGWGRRLQDTFAWLWFLVGANLALYTAIRPPTEELADLALWALAGVFGLSGFLWLVLVNRVRPRQWFRTMDDLRQAY